ncbi:MAG: macrolide ABC transporter ATP-binding protein [Candidatus Yonathbacteria bacterium RIFCSPHIGHO2_01_FULL_51_10]|uniref:Macrolide ABC transporter ATP-binding protein n=1 Tax=Candidatus Yonathbacteria bacterium RIFCSPHIGHO2_01_FULL_51_10 TaxID=1802723 RepID=A0A1G2SB54_9BACT|nr:MAG: macrolide ABC transporter ATP-binding protein [Candidatus Yonathbacteria bacterium RIFCSPHIGHO2_01_FULL_51_10]
MYILEARQLTKTYHDGEVETQVLKGISFGIRKGEFVAIMGPSGSGKSTLLHILGFLDRQTSGTYLFDDTSSDNYSEDDLARIRNEKVGFVFQSFNLLPRVSVLENVMLPLLYSSVPEIEWHGRAVAAIEAVGLSHRSGYDASRLSGGEKQRTAIARSLVNHPDIIFADEPTGNLDTQSGKAVMEILEGLNRDHGHTIILITHETFTASHAERILHIRDGMIEQDEQVRDRVRADSFVK